MTARLSDIREVPFICIMCSRSLALGLFEEALTTIISDLRAHLMSSSRDLHNKIPLVEQTGLKLKK